MADAGQVREAVEWIQDTLGPVDVWVNAAFASVIAPFGEIEPNEYHQVTDVCHHGYVHGIRTALALMAPRERGVIEQVGSTPAYRGIPFQAAYCGAEHAVRGFTDSVRAELVHAGSRIRVTEVHLPAINTPRFS
ncbi:SDR family NAD(P)-dependent oxidoreductase [Nocardiopsis sp. NPDC055551]